MFGLSRDAVLTLVSVVGLLAVAGLALALVAAPPPLAWVAFALTCAVIVGLAAGTSLLVPRMRVSAPKRAIAVDDDWRLLVVADAESNVAALCDAIRARLDGAVAVHLVVPVRASHLHFLANDESDEARTAEQTMSLVVGLLRRRGISASGSVGTDKPLESMADALGTFPATRVLLAVPPEEDAYWLERDLLAKAQALTDLPITKVIVAAAHAAHSH